MQKNWVVLEAIVSVLHLGLQKVLRSEAHTWLAWWTVTSWSKVVGTTERAVILQGQSPFSCIQKETCNYNSWNQIRHQSWTGDKTLSCFISFWPLFMAITAKRKTNVRRDLLCSAFTCEAHKGPFHAEKCINHSPSFTYGNATFSY